MSAKDLGIDNMSAEAKKIIENLRTDFASMKERLSLLKKDNERLKRLTIVDDGTDIYNRRFFNQELPRKILDSCRRGEQLSIIMIDVDFFKSYNDHYGHPKGDVVLKAVAQALRRSLHRPGDIVARYGGEEFIMILTDTNRSGAKIVAETARAAVENLQIEHLKSKTSNVVTVSMGIAVRPPNWEYSDEVLLKTADNNLYTAKEKGRNQVC